MTKKITVNDKLVTKINRIISDELCLTKTKILEENRLLPYNAYEDSPEFWTKEEEGVYEYLVDLEKRLSDSIQTFLTEGNSR